MLTHSNLARQLLDHNLIQPETLVASDLVIVDAAQRHANFKVISEAGPSYMVKQGVGPERISAIAHEAAIYRLLQEREAGSALRRCLPRLYGYAPDTHLLLLELLPDAEPLDVYQHRRGRFSIRLAALLGMALDALHQIVPPTSVTLPVRPPPWGLTTHRPTLALYQEISHANQQLIQILQRFPDLGQRLDALHRAWQPTALLHYDLKRANLLVVPAVPGSRAMLKIVDWEAAGWGDPAWDVGSIFGEYLASWLNSIPLTGDAAPDQLLGLARFPLERIQPALRRFWQSYQAGARLAEAVADQRLLAAVAYSAVRLLQTTFEQNQTAPFLTGHALTFLQVAANILQRPHEAAVHLLGLPWPKARLW